ncbi:tyrosine-type recombinase/integrase [Alistipes sp. OttesenSCG-928-B03]|nr:tyrosine-type recombinase/integrase [Alistipes sp. OttesenSCG-928-B03]
MTVERFLTYLRAEKRYSEHTVFNYGRDIRRFLADSNIAEENLAFVTADDIRTWITNLTESGLSAASVNRMTSSMRALFRWLRKTGAMEGDPFLRVGFQRMPSRLPGYITEAKMGEVILDIEKHAGDDFISQRNALIITLFYTTGMRLAELVGIKLDDFSANYSELRVRGKGNKERVVPLIEYTRAKVSAYVDRIKAENICTGHGVSLFLDSKGKPVSRTEVYRVVKEELALAGVQGKRSPHILRHTFATHMLNDGADIREIQEMLGHASLAATQVYTHNSIAQLKEIYRGAHPRGRRKPKDEE